MTNQSRIDDLASRPGDTDEEHAARIRFPERLSDWSEPGAVKFNRNGNLVGPPSEPDRVELRKRINTVPPARPNC
jgi:hypothetical protein